MAASGYSASFSAPYQKVFTSFSGVVNLTTTKAAAQHLCSGLIVCCTGAGDLVWRDDAGQNNTIPLTPGPPFHLPFAAQQIRPSTFTGWIIAYWHPQSCAALNRV